MMYAVVTAIAPCERAYASRTNTTRIKRVLAIDCSLPRDDRVVSRALTLWNHRAVTMIDCRPGDVLACDARAIRPRRARGGLARDDRSLHAREDATFERLARAEDLLGRGWGRIGRVRDGGGVPSFRGCRDSADARRLRALARSARRRHAGALRREVDDVERRRRGSFSRFEASYVDAEAMGDVGVGGRARRCHFLGRVARWTVRASSRGEELGSNGGVYSRRIVWARQSANGAMVEIALPPTRESVEEARRADLERAVIDVRFALARETTVEGSCLALVCDSKYSYWRVLDASDPRYEEVCARVPETAGIDGASTCGELATRMRETGFSRESATSLISFDAVVRWVKVELEGERRYRRVPRMLLEEETATATEMIKFACLECERELVPDRNGVYKQCQCASTSDDVRCGFAWRDVVLGVCDPNDDAGEDVVVMRASGHLVRRLFFGVDPASVLRADDDDDDDEMDDDGTDVDDDVGRPRRIDHRLLVLTAINQLVAWRKNGAAARWRVKFPALDENGLARRDELELIDFNI